MRHSLYVTGFAVADVPDGGSAEPLPLVCLRVLRARKPAYKVGQSVPLSGNLPRTAHRPHPAAQPASRLGSDGLLPASGCRSGSLRHRDVLPPDAAQATLCGWWYPGQCGKWARRERRGPAPVQAARCLTRPGPYASIHRKDTDAAPDAGCRSDDSANGAVPDAGCSSDRNAGTPQSSRSRGKAAQVQSPGG